MSAPVPSFFNTASVGTPIFQESYVEIATAINVAGPDFGARVAALALVSEFCKSAASIIEHDRGFKTVARRRYISEAVTIEVTDGQDSS